MTPLGKGRRDVGFESLLAATLDQALSDLRTKDKTLGRNGKYDGFVFALEVAHAAKNHYGRSPERVKEALSMLDLSELAVQQQRDKLRDSLSSQSVDVVRRALSEFDDTVEAGRAQQATESERSERLLKERYRTAHTRSGGRLEDFDNWFESNKSTLVLSEAITKADLVDEKQAQFASWVGSL